MIQKNKIKTVFMGTPEFAVPALEALIKDPHFDIVAVITQPDKPVGRKQIMTPPPVKIIAEKNNIPVFQPEKISQIPLPASRFPLPASRFPLPDLIVVIAYGQILPKSVLESPKYGCVNVHGSLLPKYRGAACIQAAILNGDKETGITIMQMDEGLDTGPIITQNKISVSENETADSLHDKLSALSAKILPDTLVDFISGKLKPKKQSENGVSYVKQLKKEDGKIAWNKPAEDIEKMIRAYNPWPGAFGQAESIKYKVKSIKILEVENKVLEFNKYKVGEIFTINNNLGIQCGKDALVVKKLQLEGKKPISAKQFISGYKDLIGTILK